MRHVVALALLAITPTLFAQVQIPAQPAFVQGTVNMEVNLTSTVNGQSGPSGTAPLELDYSGDPATGGPAMLYTRNANGGRVFLSAGNWRPTLFGAAIHFEGNFFGGPGFINLLTSTIPGSPGFLNANDGSGMLFSGPTTVQ